jgi:hypothetical protein
MLPLVAKYLPNLRLNEGFENLFEPIEPGLYAIEQDENGVCRLACRERGRLLCSLHRAALDLGLEPAWVKPRACTLWPLILGRRDSRLVLSIDPSAESFPCVRLCSHSRSKPCPAVTDIVRALFGRRVLADLLALD